MSQGLSISGASSGPASTSSQSITVAASKRYTGRLKSVQCGTLTISQTNTGTSLTVPVYRAGAGLIVEDTEIPYSSATSAVPAAANADYYFSFKTNAAKMAVSIQNGDTTGLSITSIVANSTTYSSIIPGSTVIQPSGDPGAAEWYIVTTHISYPANESADTTKTGTIVFLLDDTDTYTFTLTINKTSAALTFDAQDEVVIAAAAGSIRTHTLYSNGAWTASITETSN